MLRGLTGEQWGLLLAAIGVLVSILVGLAQIRGWFRRTSAAEVLEEIEAESLLAELREETDRPRRLVSRRRPVKLPRGTVTFVAAVLIEKKDPAHTKLFGDLFAQRIGKANGKVVRFSPEEGRALAVFRSAADAIEATVDYQRGVLHEGNDAGEGLRAAVGVNTGEAELVEDGYHGHAVTTALAISSASHGGQIVISQATRETAGTRMPANITLKELGPVILEAAPGHVERLYQVVHADLPDEFPPLTATSARNHNLPVHLTNFVGRTDQIEALKKLVLTARLVTLTGPGGAGKTRLATRVAEQLTGQFPDGIWLVELAAVQEPDRVPYAIASVLGMQEGPAISLHEALVQELTDKELLLLLDNCEHLITECATLADGLLHKCPNLRLLATSRESLGVQGEHAWPVPPLDVPSKDDELSADEALGFAALALFEERARQVRPDFRIDPGNASAVAEICRRLDGMPFAIELAAAKTKVLSPQEIAARLDESMRFLTGPRTAETRQQTLTALIDWSYQLVSEAEKRFLRRLSIFAGGFDITAAEGICADASLSASEIFSLLESLTSKSLVTAQERSGRVRYSLLEVVRQFAADLLVDEEASTLEKRHLEWFLALAKSAEQELLGAQQAEWLERLEVEHDNFRSALRRAGPSSAEEALILASSLARFWYVRGHLSEGLEWLLQTLGRTRGSDPQLRIKALVAAGVLAKDNGNYEAARTALEESLLLSRQIGHERNLAASLLNLGLVDNECGDYISARSRFEESIPIWKKLDDRRSLTAALTNLGLVEENEGNLARARELYEESFVAFQELDDRWSTASTLVHIGHVLYLMGHTSESKSTLEKSLSQLKELGAKGSIARAIFSLAKVARAEEDPTTARQLFQEAIALRAETGDRQGIPECLEGLASVVTAHDGGLAAKLLGAADGLRESLGVPLPPSSRDEYKLVRQDVQQKAGLEAFDLAFSAGRSLRLEDVVTLVRTTGQ